MNSINPYLPPTSDLPPSHKSRPLREYRAVGVCASVLMGSLYVITAGVSIYEYVRLSPPIFALIPPYATDYVRTAIVSVPFAILSFTATVCFLKRIRLGNWLLLLSPMLLMVFVYPGLNTVWNFVERLFSF